MMMTYLLHASSCGCTLPGSLGSQLLAGCLATSGLAGCLFGPSHVHKDERERLRCDGQPTSQITGRDGNRKLEKLENCVNL